EERLQRNNDARHELRGHRLAVESDQLGAGRAVAVRRDEAGTAVRAVVDGQVNREKLDFEHVAGLRTVDVDGAGENVTARSAAGIPLRKCGKHRLVRSLDLLIWNSQSREGLRGAR